MTIGLQLVEKLAAVARVDDFHNDHPGLSDEQYQAQAEERLNAMTNRELLDELGYFLREKGIDL